jgi:ATP/maltotriose-dependent transcriptional regulator MalT
MRLVGRDRERGCLVSLLDGDDGGAGGGRAVAVVGEPGIGKTRLLRELVRLAGERGIPVASGAATEFERHQVFGVFQEALADLLATVPPARLAPLGGDQLALLRSVFPALPGPPAGQPVPDVERFRLYRAVGALLAALAGPGRLVLVLDDLHWADQGSIELCAHVLRHPPAAGLVLALAYRSRQVPVRLAVALAAAASQHRVRTLELGPLGFADAAALLPERADRPTRERLYRLSEGNPLYLEALTRTGDGEQRPIQLALAAELTALAPVPLLVARAAAVLGDAGEPAVLAEVAGLPLDAVLPALDELVARDLLRPAEVPGRFRFRHPLVRRAGYQSSGAGWRVAAHARAAAALRSRGAPVTDQARHVERCAVRGDERHLTTLVAAADSAMHANPAVAAHWLAAALRLLPDGAAGPRRLDLLTRLARALGVSGRLRDSRRANHQVLELLPRGTGERARAACFCAMVERLLGRFAEAHALLLAELADLAEPDSRAGVIIRIGLASGYLLGGSFHTEREWAREAAESAERLGDPPLRAAALAIQALAILMGADTGAGDRNAVAAAGVREAALAMDALPDGQVAGHTIPMLALGWCELFLERYADAERHLRRATGVARTAGQVYLYTHLTLALGSVIGRTGDLARAASCFDDALDAALLTGSDELRTMAQASRCWVLSWQGDLEAAARAGEEAVAVSGSVRDYFFALSRFRLAQVRFYAGDLDGCAELLLDGCGGPDLRGLEPVSRIRACDLLAAVDAARSRPERLGTWTALASRVAAAAGTPICTGLARLGQAEVLHGSDPDRALELADEAVRAFEQTRVPVDLGRAHLTAGKILAAAGDQAAARARFALAREHFAACGAGLFLRLADREERRANARLPRRRVPAHAPESGLSRRERDIAELVAIGLTNREIAERLYLSPRTVESHLARVFAKLGVRTRAAVGHVLGSVEPPDGEPGGRSRLAQAPALAVDDDADTG